MRRITGILFAVLVAAWVNAIEPEESIGDWSPEHQNLRARLVARYTSSSFGDPKPGAAYSVFFIYLELRNPSPMELKLDIDTVTNITFRVTDERGSLIEPTQMVFRSTVLPGPFDLVLPPDSFLRFLISVNGGGVFKDKVKLDVNPYQGIWFFPEGSGRELYLSGTLRVPLVRERIGPLWWRGELEIPPVKLTIPGKAQPGAAPNAAEPHR